MKNNLIKKSVSHITILTILNFLSPPILAMPELQEEGASPPLPPKVNWVSAQKLSRRSRNINESSSVAKASTSAPEGPHPLATSASKPTKWRRSQGPLPQTHTASKPTKWRDTFHPSPSPTNLTPPLITEKISKESEVVQEKNQSAQSGLPRCVRGLEPEDPKKKFELAKKYYTGDKNTPMNKTEAVRLFQEGAEEGYGPSEEALAECYDKGEGTPQDYEKAMKWSLRAAEKGNADAQYRLANYYYHGKVVPEDKIKAKELYLKAAQQGHHFMALVKLKTYYPFDEKDENEKRAMIWLKERAEEGSKEAKTLSQELQKTIEARKEN